MRNDKIIPGAVLIMIGAIILLHNFGYVAFHWANFVYLIPILIVIAGINLIFGHNNRSAWATVVKLAVVAIGFCLILFGNFGRRHNGWNDYSYNFDTDNDDDSTGGKIVKVEGSKVFDEPYTTAIKVAELNISGGGALYKLSDTTNQLFSADTKVFGKHFVNYLTRTNSDSVAVLSYKMKNSHGFNFDFDDEGKKDGKYGRNNTAIFKLNPNPEWKIDVKTGATKLDFDLSKFKVRSLKLSGGAADFSVKLGQPLSATNVVVSTGMSSVSISVPTTAACRIISSTGLSSTNFEGFTKTKDNTYETPGFSTATNKLFIKMSGGMADFNVKRY